jgi:hypothetical protein
MADAEVGKNRRLDEYMICFYGTELINHALLALSLSPMVIYLFNHQSWYILQGTVLVYAKTWIVNIGTIS